MKHYQLISAAALLAVLAGCPGNVPAGPKPSPTPGATTKPSAAPTAPVIKGPTQGLVAYYPFEGNANDLSGNGNNGQVAGDVKFVTGMIGKAAEFTSEGNLSEIMVRHSASLSPTTALTLSAWTSYNKDFNGGFYPVLTKGKVKEDYTLWAVEGGLEVLMDWETPNQFWAHSEGEVHAPNQWHLLTATYDGQKVTYYLDGEKQNEYPYTARIDASGEDLYIGTSYPGDVERWHGWIDELRIYSRALSAQEVETLYQLK
ncbi:MAG TPA: LamG domain-containing protein [Candidatus Obscuribacterales bacterium]